ncbi:MAG TPA: lipid A deacylase LpxR family protein [Opitutales bacterium]|nr:lipid A deacylase LpxR family protein [Opitutales bacterium]
MQRFTPPARALLGALGLLGFTSVLSAQTAANSTAATTAGSAAAPGFAPVFPEGIWELSHENDWFIHSDRDFTSGLRLAYTTPNFREWKDVPLVPVAVGNMFDQVSFISGDWATVAAGVYVQQNMYTPDDLRTNPPNPQDHPYAGWLGVGMDLIRESAERRAIFELNVGIVGPYSGAQDLQQSFHDLIKSTDPQGWDRQIQTEPVLQLTHRQDWRLPWLTNFNAGAPQTWGYDVVTHALLTVGNGWDYAAVGGMFRIGYHLPLDFGPSRMRLGEISSLAYQPGGSTATTGTNWSLDTLTTYFCIGTEARAVARDISLNGNTWRSSAHVSQEPLVDEAYGGLVVEYGHFRGSFLIIRESKTFYSQPQKDQWRGTLSVGCSF